MIPPPLETGAVGVMPKMYYVYLLQSVRTGQCYLGWTTDLQRRLCQHNDDERDSGWTRGRGPYELVYFEAYRHREEAVAREGVLKKRHNVMKQLKKRLHRTLATASSEFQEVGG